MFFSYEAPKVPFRHFWPKAKLAQITLPLGSNFHSIQLIVMKFAQLSHFSVLSVLLKGKCAISEIVLHMHTFIIFYIIKIYYFLIIIKLCKMIKCHTLNYFCLRRNMYRINLDKIYPNISNTFSIIIWYVRSGAEKSAYFL